MTLRYTLVNTHPTGATKCDDKVDFSWKEEVAVCFEDIQASESHSIKEVTMAVRANNMHG